MIEMPDRIIFVGSGAFGLPTLRLLAERSQIALVISQPPRPAGRGREAQRTPVHTAALELGIEVMTPASIAEPAVRHRVAEEVGRVESCAMVVIAFGGKLPPELLACCFTINLHGSLLPRWRGAAPVQRALMAGDRTTGVSVISLAPTMDAGEIYAQAETEIRPDETAGELHDRLAELGPPVVAEVLAAECRGLVVGRVQDPALVTHARKLAKAEGTTAFDGDADHVRARIHGLTPWPGCRVACGEAPLMVRRVRATSQSDAREIGGVDALGRVRCGRSAVELLEVQAPGGRVLSFAEFVRGRPQIVGAVLKPWSFSEASGA